MAGVCAGGRRAKGARNAGSAVRQPCRGGGCRMLGNAVLDRCQVSRTDRFRSHDGPPRHIPVRAGTGLIIIVFFFLKSYMILI